MNNDNTVKIGVALKWRNTFDTTKRYYQENVVTACGCVFRCKVLQAQGKSPIRFTDEQGHIAYTNTDTWDVLVDMAYYYNYTVDTRKLTQEMLDYAKKLDAAFQKQQQEIKDVQDDDKDQWKHINDIEKVNAEQQRELNSVFDTISCFSEGIWIDTLLWSDVTIWDNNKYAITDDLQNQINVLTENHNQDIKDLTDKHNSELSALTANIIKQNKIQDSINDYLQDQVYDLNSAVSCFSVGIWENDLHWSQEALWDNNKYAITDALSEELETLKNEHNKDVKNINAHLLSNDQEFAKAVLQNASEHRLVNDHLDKHDTEIKNLQTLIKEHDQQIIDLIDTLACFSNGYWDDGLKWSDVALWENSNLMYDTFDDIYCQIEKHQKSISDLTKEIQKVKSDAQATMKSINETFAGFRKEHEDFRNEHESFRKEHKAITGRIDGLDQLCESQQHEINSLLYRVSILTNGVWNNNLLWVNESDWNNTDLNGTCHCPEDTEERLDGLQEGLDAIKQRVLDTEENIKQIKQDAVTEHRSVAYQLRAIGREQVVQDENIAKLGEHFSCYADGVWGDLFIWDNELLWANETGVVNEAISDLRNDIRDIRYKLNEANEDIMTNLSLIRANHQLIEVNAAGIQKNKESIEITQSELQSATDEIRKEALTEHRQVAYQLRAIGREQTAQDESIAKLGEHFGCFVDGVWGDLFLWKNDHLWHNEPGVIEEALTDIHSELDEIQEKLLDTIEEAAEHFNCFGDGYWCNTSVWNNDCYWKNGTHELGELYIEHRSDVKMLQAQISDIDTEAKMQDARIGNIDTCIEEIKTTQATQQVVIDNHQTKLNELWEQKFCLDEGEWNNDFFWNETEQWLNTPKSLSEIEAEVIKQDDRISALENQFKLFMQQFAVQQTIIEQQKEQLETLMDCFTVLNVGKWQNLLLWDNNSKWSNELITEAAASIGTGGASTVTVKAYDPATGTVTI